MDKKNYEAPTVKTLGTVAELTEAFNKVGLNDDTFTAVTNGAIVGSIVSP